METGSSLLCSPRPQGQRSALHAEARWRHVKQVLESIHCASVFKKVLTFIFLFNSYECFRGEMILIFWVKKMKTEPGREVSSWSPARQLARGETQSRVS